MPDIRELFDAGPDEAFRIAFGALQSDIHTAAITQVTETSDGHNVTHVPVIKKATLDQTRTQVTYQDHPLLMDTPVSFPGGAGATLTHGLVKGDEILTVFASRPIDTWRQSGGTQQPITDRIHDVSDAVAIPNVRSDPRRLQQVAPDAMHMRDDAKRHVNEMHPDRGHRVFSADPSTPAASKTFDPLSMASKFVDHAVQGAKGLLARAVTGGTTHDHGIDFGTGPFMRAANALHTMLCHAQNGPSMNALNGLHQVLAHSALGAILSSANGKNTVTATIGGVMLQSPTSISMSCPPGGLNLPAGGVSGNSLAPGAASQNVGTVGGDLSGVLPNPQVVSILNVSNANLLPSAANDGAAAALVPPVQIGHLYRNGSVLMVRVA